MRRNSSVPERDRGMARAPGCAGAGEENIGLRRRAREDEAGML